MLPYSTRYIAVVEEVGIMKPQFDKPVNAAPSRRDTLRLGIATAALSVVSSCQLFRTSALDSVEDAHEQLRKVLAVLAEDDLEEDRLTAIGRRISHRATELVEEHMVFIATFERVSAKWDSSSGSLEELIGTFGQRRKQVRAEMLGYQDELRAELSEGEWIEVREALNLRARHLAEAQSFRSEKG